MPCQVMSAVVGALLRESNDRLYAITQFRRVRKKERHRTCLHSSGSTMGYICIHGHFYQPPRENPWLEAVELQDSAYPYHDWNERITAECYAPNGASRILNPEGRVAQDRQQLWTDQL